MPDEARRQRIAELQNRIADRKANAVNPWQKARDYTALGVRGASALVPGGPLGAIAGGVGELAAQGIEGRDEFNFAQVGTQAALGFVPFGRTASLARGAAKGAAMGTGAAVATQQAEQGLHVPTKEDIKHMALPALIGGGAGAVSGRLQQRSQQRALAPPPENVPDVTPPPSVAPPPSGGRGLVLAGGRDAPDLSDLAQQDAMRGSTLSAVRARRLNPDAVAPRESQAIADNLAGRFNDPNALDEASQIQARTPTRDVSRADTVMSGQRAQIQSPRARLMDLAERDPAMMSREASRARSSRGPTDRGVEFRPASPEVTLGTPPAARAQRRTGNRKNRGRGIKPVIKDPGTQMALDNIASSPMKKNIIKDIDLKGTEGRPFARSSDSDLEFLSTMKGSDGVAAKTELEFRKNESALNPIDTTGPDGRPNKPFGTRGEIGAVGDISKHPAFGRGGRPQRRPFVDNPPIVSKVLKRADEHTSGFRESYQKWVGSRNAAKVEGILKRREFTNLDGEGLEGIKKFQTGLRSGKFQDVQKYFDTKHASIEKAGVKLGFKENYLPQLWDNPVDEIQEVARKLGLKPRFAMASVLENYEKGLALGLKPKFEKISDLIGWYEKTANKAVADREFFNWINTKGLIKPGAKVPRNGTWSPLNAEHFPVQKFKGKTKEYTQDLWAPKDVARIINNYLEPPHGQVLNKVADFASTVKNFALSGGIPKTAINFHGFNILVRNAIGKGVGRGTVEAGKFLVNPKSAVKDLEKNLHKAPFFMRRGLKLSTEGFEFGESSAETLTKRLDPKKNPLASMIFNPITSLQEKVLKFHGEYFEKPLFQQALPALKLRYVEEMFGKLKAGGMNTEEAAKAASSATNDLFGGMNWEAAGRSRELQNWMRTLILAPDWLETSVKTGRNVAEALRNPNSPKGLQIVTIAKNLTAAYAAANVANYAMSGKMMWENDPGHALDVYTGQADGKDMYFRPFGTAADFARLPVDMVSSAYKKDLGQGFQILRNRMSLPGSSAVNLLTQRNRFGRKIFGRDDFGRDIPVSKQIMSGIGEVGDLVTPPYAQSVIRSATGDIGPVEAITGGIESPVRFANPRNPASSRRRRRPTRPGRR